MKTPFILSLCIFLSFCKFDASAQINLANGLVAYYPFNANSNDESINNNHLTNLGATLTTDRFGNANSAFSFNVGQSLETNNPALPLGADARTISAWIRPTIPHNQNTGQQIMGWGQNVSNSGCGFYLINFRFNGANVMRFWNFGADVNVNFSYPTAT